jgi:chromosome segregation and condensation protein ScpB
LAVKCIVAAFSDANESAVKQSEITKRARRGVKARDVVKKLSELEFDGRVKKTRKGKSTWYELCVDLTEIV